MEPKFIRHRVCEDEASLIAQIVFDSIPPSSDLSSKLMKLYSAKIDDVYEIKQNSYGVIKIENGLERCVLGVFLSKLKYSDKGVYVALNKKVEPYMPGSEAGERQPTSHEFLAVSNLLCSDRETILKEYVSIVKDSYKK